MRKIFLIIIMLLTFCSCGNTSKDEPRDLGYLGTWYLYDKVDAISNINPFIPDYGYFYRGSNITIEEDCLKNADYIVEYDVDEKGYLYVDKSLNRYGEVRYLIEVNSYDNDYLYLNVTITDRQYYEKNTKYSDKLIKFYTYKFSKLPLYGCFDEQYSGEHIVTAICYPTHEYYKVKNTRILIDYIPLLNILYNTDETVNVTKDKIIFNNANMEFVFDYDRGEYFAQGKNTSDGDVYYQIGMTVDERHTARIYLRVETLYSGIYYYEEPFEITNVEISYFYQIVFFDEPYIAK